MENKEITTINIEDLNDEKIKDVIVTIDYVPFVEKVNTVKKILEINIDKKNGNIVIDHTKFYMSMYLIISSLYFNFRIGKISSTNYDKIKPYQLIETLIKDNEKQEWLNISKAEIQNLCESNTYKQIFGNLIYQIREDMVPIFDGITKMLDKGDPNKIAKYLSPSFEIIANKMPDFKNKEQVENFIKTINRRSE